MKSLTLKRLEEDKKKLGVLVAQIEQQINELITNRLRYLGTLGYIEDNIKEMKEVEDAGKRDNNKE